MATMTMSPGLAAPEQHTNGVLNTLPDPRSPIPSPNIPRSNSSSPHHPELSNEVATLSNKLIHAINHQTDLDDTLNETRHELEAAHEHVRRLERTIQEHNSLVANGILIQRVDVEADTLRLKTALAEERRAKFQMEKEKKAIEQELESLTTALFEEANQMVANARKDAKKERDVIERRNEQLQAKLNDAELLLASHQEQLAELKKTLQQRNDLETQTAASSAPTTPALDLGDNTSRALDTLNTLSSIPAPPTSFTSLLHPVLRTDVQAFEDFQALLEISRRSQPSSRVNSGTYSGLVGLGLGNLTHRDASHVSGRLTHTTSTSSLSASNNHPPSPGTPNLPPSNNSSVSSRDIPLGVTPLKETSFYKRILSEDLEPTLRLDLAPGLSWLARRGVISAMSEGKLVVEPMTSVSRLYQPPCALCGEQGRGEKKARRHKFRTSESENAQRYPLCDFCLNRVRASCDFLGFLRMIKDGHWRTDGTEAENMAWEESVRLRERMFWARMGGGVIPAFLRNQAESPRHSTEEEKADAASIDKTASSHESEFKPDDHSPLPPESPAARLQQGVDNFNSSKPHPVEKSEDSFQEHLSTGTPVKSSPASPSKPDFPDKSPSLPSRTPLTRTTTTINTPTRSRGSSRGEFGGRPSAAQTVAQRAAMFDRPINDDAAASKQLQSSLQASVRASIKERSPSSRGEGRSQSPAGSSPVSRERPQLPPQLPSRNPAVPPPSSSSTTTNPSTTLRTESIPGSFDF